MKNTRRNFFKKSAAFLLLLAALPGQLLGQNDDFPDVEDGVQLRKIYRDGKRIRMGDLKKGDAFEMVEEDRRVACVADSDPFKMDIGDGRKTWTVHGRVL